MLLRLMLILFYKGCHDVIQTGKGQRMGMPWEHSCCKTERQKPMGLNRGNERNKPGAGGEPPASRIRAISRQIRPVRARSAIPAIHCAEGEMET